MEEKEIAIVERFVKEMEEFGYRFSINVSEKPSTVELEMALVEVSLTASKGKPKGESLWREIITRFFL